MPKTVKQALEQKSEGYHIGHRIILPFRCQIIKIIVEGTILTEMVGSDQIKIQQDPKNTSIYIRSVSDLNNFVGSYKVVKMAVCEWDADLCNPDNHIKLICEIKEGHAIVIHEPSDDMLFIE